MTLTQILNLSVKRENFNTNNSWGFGGGTGVMYTFSDGSFLRIGVASYRHLPSSKFVTYTSKEGDRLIDVTKLSDKHIQYIFEQISKK